MGILILLIVLLVAAACFMGAAVLNKGKLGGTVDRRNNTTYGGASARLVYGGIAGVLCFIMVLLVLLNGITTVGIGNVGIPVTFGSAGSDLSPGIHFKAPWTDVISMSVRTQTVTMNAANGNEVSVRTQDGASVGVDVVLQFNVSNLTANSLYRGVGTDYVNLIVEPTLRSALQDLSVNYDAVPLYSTDRTTYSQAVQTQLQSVLGGRGITVESLLIQQMTLSPTLSAAVDAKLAAQQAAQQQVYALQSAEAAIHVAAAQAEANAILSKSLTPAIVCNTWLTDLAAGKITGPIYVSPCSSSGSGVTPLIQNP